ncbi:MAG: hypothetical protein LQ352_006637 [Teloschistes flavicans]|nr:MAG: hypothetical protein LQ352_006637 [Teloschistes flavicans]
MDSLPLVEIQIFGALDEEEKCMLTQGIAGDFWQEDGNHEFSSSDSLSHQEDADAEDAGNNSSDDEADSDNDQNVYIDDGDTTDGDDYDEDHPAFNKNHYVEYSPEDEEVIASRKRYIRARFDNDGDDLADLSALSSLAQKHRPNRRTLLTIRYICEPEHWYRMFPWDHPIENQYSLGIKLLRTIEHPPPNSPQREKKEKPRYRISKPSSVCL